MHLNDSSIGFLLNTANFVLTFSCWLYSWILEFSHENFNVVAFFKDHIIHSCHLEKISEFSLKTLMQSFLSKSKASRVLIKMDSNAFFFSVNFSKFPEWLSVITHLNTYLCQYKIMNLGECLLLANFASGTNTHIFIFSSGLRRKKLKIIC